MKIEDKKKIINKLVRFMFLSLLVLFTFLYFSQGSGYSEYKLHQQVVLTNEQIKRFEEDVKNNKNINIEDYYETVYVDYNNKASKFGLKVSEKMGDYVKSGIEVVFGALNKFIEE